MYIEKMKAEAQENIERARSILRLAEEADAKLRDPQLHDRAEVEAERNRFLAKARDHIKFTARNLFDAFAEECWKVIRPDSESFSKLLPEISDEVARVVFGPDLDNLVADTLTARTTKWAQRTAREGAVRNSSEWAALRSQFAALARQENESLGKVADIELFHAFADYEIGLGEFGHWSLGGSTESIRSDFMVYATRAAVALGAPSGVDLADYWLHRLFTDLLENRSKHLFCAREGEGGMIKTLLEASASYCARLEQTALANDHQRKAVPVVDIAKVDAKRTPSDQGITAETFETPIAGKPELEALSEKAQRRKAILDPLLKSKLMTVNQWADAASAEGVAHSTVFRYYNGETNPRIRTLEALARPFGLKAEDLPN